jgi:putative flippase GtrA
VTLLRTLYAKVEHLVHELLKFGTVGAFAFVVDVGLFNLLVHAGGNAPLHDKPLTGKAISTIIATGIAYLGNRHWTFRHRDHGAVVRQVAIFFGLNAVGLSIAVGCLGISRYVLDLHGAIADNIAANVVGIGLAMLFRFWSYRRWVFRAPVAADAEPPRAPARAA